MAILPWGKKKETIKKAEEMLAQCRQNLNLPEKQLGKSGCEWISRRKWSDDPNEMQRLIYYAAVASRGDNIEAHHFPPVKRVDHEAYAGKEFEEIALEEMVRQKIAHFFDKLGNVEAKGVHATVISKVEKPLIEICLAWAKGNQLKAARVLGLNRNTLRKKINLLKIEIKR